MKCWGLVYGGIYARNQAQATRTAIKTDTPAGNSPANRFHAEIIYLPSPFPSWSATDSSFSTHAMKRV